MNIKGFDFSRDRVRVEFLKTDEKAKLPTRNHGDIEQDGTLYIGTCDSGFDIYGIEDTVIPAHGSAVVPTGIKVAYITPGFWFKIESRSGLSFKHGVLAHPGIIDNQYRGDTGVKLYNHSSTPYTVAVGERIAQMVVYPIINPDVTWADSISESVRGDKGFGSSGKQ